MGYTICRCKYSTYLDGDAALGNLYLSSEVGQEHRLYLSLVGAYITKVFYEVEPS